MKKNDKSLISGLSVEQIEQQKAVLQKELENIEKMKNQLTIKSYAISGALQQCDVFIQLIKDSSGASPASSIPSNESPEALSEVFS